MMKFHFCCSFCWRRFRFFWLVVLVASSLSKTSSPNATMTAVHALVVPTTSASATTRSNRNSRITSSSSLATTRTTSRTHTRRTPISTSSPSSTLLSASFVPFSPLPSTSLGGWLPLLVELRGGTTPSQIEAAARVVAINLSRESYHLQVMATYGTMTALIMNAALRLYTSTKFPSTTSDTALSTYTKRQIIVINIGSILFLLTSSLCIISGAFTAILFQLLGIYGKSALSMMNDAGYLQFQSSTAVYAKWGFRCFLTSLSSFVGSFLLSLSTKTIFSKENKNTLLSSGSGSGSGSSNSESENESTTANTKTATTSTTPTTAPSRSLLKTIKNYVQQVCCSVGNAQLAVMTISILLTLLGAFHIKNILNLASQHIFVEAFADRFWRH